MVAGFVRLLEFAVGQAVPRGLAFGELLKFAVGQALLMALAFV
jgi:hypothetical protein